MKTTTSVELKYCERCGSLWLREAGSAQVYCVRCQTILDDWPAAPKRSFPKLPVAAPITLDDIDFEIHINNVEDIEGTDDVLSMACPAAGGVA